MSSIRRTSLPMLAAAVLAVAGASFVAAPALAQRGRGRDDRDGRSERVHRDHGRRDHDRRRSARVVVHAERPRAVHVHRPRQRVVVVRPAPPPPRVVVVPARPRPNLVWVEGYWRWNGRDYVWVPGRWVAERRGRRFVQARWEMRGGEWTFVPGGWVVVTN